MVNRANKAFKTGNLSLTSAIKKYRIYANESGFMNDYIESVIIDDALKYDNILENINQERIKSKTFTLWSIAMAVNKKIKS